ncbi:MAG: hypothetical protein ACI8TL_000379 [Natronomonas sp.]|jgi:hypothetical protein
MCADTGYSRVFSASSAESADDREWYRGQLHVHTNVHDKSEMVQWYREHGYEFVVVTDINYATPVEGLKSVYDEDERFLVVPGINTSTRHENTILDVMGYGGSPAEIQFDSVVSPVDDAFLESTGEQPGDDRAVSVPSEPANQTYSLQSEWIAEADGIPAIAHPNLTWAAGVDELLSVDPELLWHFEMITTEPGMNDAGGGGYPSTTEMWDRVLATGRVLYAIASDDSHHIDRVGPETRPVNGDIKTYPPALPDRTSVFVYARDLSVESVIDAVERGDFYSVRHELTLPIAFEDVTVTEDEFELTLPRESKDIGWSSRQHNPTRYRTKFIGRETGDEEQEDDGSGDAATVLEIDESYTPSYSFTGTEQYVRARVEGSDGAVAWTQPVFCDGRLGPE